MRNLIAPAVLAAGLMLGSAALAATPQTATAAPPVVQREVVGRTTIGAPIEQTTVSEPVSYDGMDPANPADVKVIDRRIQRTAQQECAELRDQSAATLDSTIGGGYCVRMAEHDARASLGAATSAAQALQ